MRIARGFLRYEMALKGGPACYTIGQYSFVTAAEQSLTNMLPALQSCSLCIFRASQEAADLEKTRSDERAKVFQLNAGLVDRIWDVLLCPHYGAFSFSRRFGPLSPSSSNCSCTECYFHFTPGATTT